MCSLIIDPPICSRTVSLAGFFFYYLTVIRAHNSAKFSQSKQRNYLLQPSVSNLSIDST
ncbi:MAG: hypothetical protein OFPI_31080 [Osedax symbiont Rs2]|nr:MAG: hypothetical protein OFPI_31080 [Osedax symbiont Rs2]